MPESLPGAHPTSKPDPSADDMGHPRGTLAIVVIYGVLLALGWLAMYVFGFLERGAPSLR